jgi:hypothetical protein
MFTCDWITTCRTGKLTALFQKKKTLLHGQYPVLKLMLCTGQLQEPKFCTCYSGRRLWPKCRFGAGNKTNSTKTCTSPPAHFQIIPNSCELLLFFPCLFPTFLGRMFSRDYGDRLYGSCPSEVPLSREHVQADKCPTPWRQHSARRTKRNRISY